VNPLFIFGPSLNPLVCYVVLLGRTPNARRLALLSGAISSPLAFCCPSPSRSDFRCDLQDHLRVVSTDCLFFCFSHRLQCFFFPLVFPDCVVFLNKQVSRARFLASFLPCFFRPFSPEVSLFIWFGDVSLIVLRVFSPPLVSSSIFWSSRRAIGTVWTSRPLSRLFTCGPRRLWCLRGCWRNPFILHNPFDGSPFDMPTAHSIHQF